MNYEWLNENSRKFLENGYLSEGETPEERIEVIAQTAENILGIDGFADKFKGYMAKGWISLSSPIWANFGKKRASPISCFSSHIDDSMGSILYTAGEVGMMSKLGGGTSGYVGEIRPRGSDITDNGKTSGAVHFLELFEAVTDVTSQGATRRGRFCPYMPVDHGDINEFLDIGTEGHPIQSMTTAVVLPEYWMEEMINGDQSKRKIWGKILRRRSEVGFPYCFFHGAAQKFKSKIYKDKNIEITNSQLCSELLLPVSSDESFVCDLSSVNVLHYEDYKNTDLIETVVYLLDAVMTEFIQKLEMYRDSDSAEDKLVFEYMKRAYKFAKRHRAIGVGVLGLHSYFQSNNMAFTSDEANAKADEIFKHLYEHAYKGSEQLADKLGECEMTEGYGIRHTTLTAVAPTVSSSAILGQVSQSIEPLMSNYYIKDLAKMKYEVKNKFLEQVLENKGANTKAVWDSIAKNDGSVQHLTDILDDHEMEVFLTFPEIDQKKLIDQAAIRQQHLDQTQSMNLMISASASPKEVNEITLYAYKKGLPTLYYQHSTNAAQQFLRGKNNPTCTSCEA